MTDIEICEGCDYPISECKKYGTCCRRIKNALTTSEQECARLREALAKADRWFDDHRALIGNTEVTTTVKESLSPAKAQP